MFKWLLGGSPLPSLTAQETQARVLAAPKRTQPIILDVREPYEYAQGHAKGARNIPLGTLASRMAEVPRDREVYVICQSGNRSAQATRMLIKAGFEQVFNVQGGMFAWMAAKLPRA